MELQFDNPGDGTMKFQLDNGGDVFATVAALRVAADRWVDAADTMKEAGSAFRTTATWYQERAVAARRIAEQIEAAAKAADGTDTSRPPFTITWIEQP